MADGTITIETELATDKFDRQIAQLEKKNTELENKYKEIDIKLNDESITKTQQEFDNLKNKAKELELQLKKLEGIRQVGIETGKPMSASTYLGKKMDLQAQLDMTNTQLKEQEALVSKVDDKAIKLYNSQEKIGQQIEENNAKIRQLTMQKQVAEAEAMKGGLEGVKTSFSSLIKQALKYTLAVFGIRGAYMAVRRASSELAQYDTKYAANLEYIRYVLTQAIAPILRYLVNLAGTLLSYIYYVLNAWFGISKYINVGAKGFSKMKASAGGTAKAVKEIKKQLAGFDEMNVLQDNSSAGGGGASVPDFDVSKMQGDVPKWLKWIADHKKLILGILGFLAGAVLLAKLVRFLSGIKAIADGCSVLVGWISKLTGGFSLLKALGIGLVITGIVLGIKDLIKFIKDKSWSNFFNIVTDIAIVLAGVALVTGNVGIAIAALVVGIVGAVGSFLTEERAVMSVVDAKKQLEEATNKVIDAENNYVNAFDRAEQTLLRLQQAEANAKISGEELYASVQNGTLTYGEMTQAQKDVFKAYLDNKTAQEELQKATDDLTNAKNVEKKASEDLRLATLLEQGQFDEYKRVVVEAFERGELSAEEARDKIEQAMKGMSASSKKTFRQDLPADINDGLNPNRYESRATQLVNFFKNLADRIKSHLNFNVNANFSVSGGYGGGAGGGGYRAKGGIFYPSKLPKLALGGIINMPGRGAPYNGALIGERGAEAVVPLTDTQQMELLGATIGKYITINANIVNKMNGRIISRELKQIQNDQDFAYNS